MGQSVVLRGEEKTKEARYLFLVIEHGLFGAKHLFAVDAVIVSTASAHLKRYVVV